MRRKQFLLNTGHSVWLKYLLLMMSCSAFHAAMAQPIAGIKANGRIMNVGDTVMVCIGGTVVHETTAQNFSAIRWRFNNGSPNSGISGYQPIKYLTTGIDTSWQIVTSSLGSDSTYILVQVTDVKPTADFLFAPDGQCANIPINFTSTSTGSGLQYAWNFSDNGASSIEQNPTYQFLNAIGVSGTQTYNVKLVVTNSTQCQDSITKIVTVQKIPDAAIGNADPAVQFSMFNGIPTFKKCENLPSYDFKFNGASTTPGIITGYTIDWGDGSPTSSFVSFPPVFSHTYATGQYVLTVTATSAGCTGVKKYNVFIGTTPAGGLIPLANNSICAPNLLTFPVTGTGANAQSTTYTFSVNDGTSSITYSHPPPASITHLFTSGSCGNSSSNGSQSFSNSFRVSLDIENACGVTSSSVIPIYISGKPKASISAPPVVCTNVLTNILNTSPMGGTITPTGGGNSTCTNTSRSVWTITPSTGFTIAPGSSLGSFNGDPTNYLSWTSGSNPLGITFHVPGIYTIKLNVANECGMSETSRNICVRNAPTASFTLNNRGGCGPVTTSFTNTSPVDNSCLGESYKWQVAFSDPTLCGQSAGYAFINGTNDSSANPVIAFTNPGIYIVSLNVLVNGSTTCYATATDTIVVVGKSSVVLNPLAAVCVGNSIFPTAQVSSCYSTTPTSYSWTFTNGTPASSNQLTPGAISYTANGTHPITLQVTNACGITAVSTNAVITTSPVANAGPDKSICSGDTTTIGASGFTGIIYSWSPATKLSSKDSANPKFTAIYNGANNDTTYMFVLSTSAGVNCSAKDTVYITVKKKPVVNVTPITSQICSGATVQLTATGAASYVWSPSNGLNTTVGSVVNASPLVTTTYTVTGYFGPGCPGANSTVINVIPTPKTFAGNDTMICSFSAPVQLTGLPSGGTWTAHPLLSANNVFEPAAAGNGTFNFIYTASNGNCIKSDTITITVIDAPVVNAGRDSTFCQDNTVVQLAATPAGGRWGGSPFVTQTGLFNISVVGSYTLVYTYGSGLCIGRDTVVMNVAGGISNNTISADQSICTGTIPTPLTGQAITGGVGTPVYQWEASTNGVVYNIIPGATSKDYAPAALSTPTWFRRLASTTLCSGQQANQSNSVKIIVNPDAVAVFTPTATNSCAPFVLTPSIINLTSYNAAVSEYRWYANGVYIGSGEVFPGYTILNNNDSVTIKLVAISRYGCKNDSTEHGFKASGSPMVFAGRDTAFCQSNFPVQLSGLPTGGRWTGSPLVSVFGIFVPSAIGVYKLVYTYGSGTCIATDTVEVTVTAGIASNTISANQTICAGTSPAALIGVAVTGGVGTVLYQWQSSPDNLVWTNITGATGKDYLPAAITQTTWFRREATTTVCSGNQASYSNAVLVTVNPGAKAVFNPQVTSGCPPFLLTTSIINLLPFNNIVSEYRWYANGNYIGSGLLFPGYTIANNNDSVVIKLVAISSFGCSNDSTQHTFYASGSPAVHAGNDTAFCQSSFPVQLVGSPAGGRWSGSSLVSLNGLFTPATVGSYNLVYTYGSGLCIASDTIVISVNSGIANNTISADQSICIGTAPTPLIGQVSTGGVGTISYQWQTSTNNVSWTDIAGATGKNYAPGALTQSTFFRRSATAAICPGSSYSPSILITVSPNATAEFNPQLTTSCPPFSLTPAIINLVPYSNSVNEYRWYANGTYIGSGQVFPGFTIINNGDSAVIKLVTISTFGCKNDSIEHTFYAGGSPGVRAGNDTTFCQSSFPVQLTGFPAGGRWTGSTLVAANGVFSPSAVGTYSLVYTVGTGACIGSDTVLITVSSGISNNTISANQSICIGTAPALLVGQQVTGGVGAVVYQWQSSIDNIAWINIPGANSKDYAPGVLTRNTYFRREAATTVCSNSSYSPAVLINVNADAKAVINPQVTSSCPPFSITPAVINLVPFSGIVNEYRWFASDVYMGSGLAFPGYTIVNNNDSVVIKLVAVSTFGCKNDSTQQTFYTAGAPGVRAGNDTIVCQSNFPIQLNGYPAGGRWSGGPYISFTGVFTPSTTGAYNLVYTFGSGTCIGSDTMVINVSSGISNNTISGDQSICVGTSPAMLVGSAIAGGVGTPAYQWQSSTDNVVWVNVAGATAKDYLPGVLSQTTWFRREASTTICSGGQSDYSTVIKITVNPNAKALFTPRVSAGCAPFTITPFNINLTTFSTVSEYRWYVNGNYIGSGQNFPGFTIVSNNDSAVVRLVAVSSFNCKNDTLEHKFFTADAPSPSFLQSDSIGCGPLQVTFTNTTANASRYTFLWNFGNGQTSLLSQPAPVTFAGAINGGDTTYTITMAAITSCDSITRTRFVTVRGKPKVSFAPSVVQGCSPFTVTFTNLGSGSNVNYVWDFGDGSAPVASNANTIQHTFTATVRTTFTVKLKGSNDCGADSANYSLVVVPNSIFIGFTVMGSGDVGCAPHTVRFVNNTTGATNFQWSFGDGNTLNTTSANDTVLHTYINPGVYNATLKAIGGCNDTTGKLTINVRPKPRVAFTATPMSVCLGDSIRFNNTSDTGTTSFWRFGDGTTSFNRDPAKAYNAAGTYRVWLFVSWNSVAAAGCTDSMFVDVQVRDTMAGAFAASDSLSSCIPFTVTFTNLSGPSSNTTWSFGDGGTATGDSVTHTFNAVGVYTVKMITRNVGGCTFTATKVVRVNAPTGSLLYNGGYACINNDVRFEVRGSGAAMYRYIFGDGDSLTTPNVVVNHKYTQPGKYLPYVLLVDGTCRVKISKGDTVRVDQVSAGFFTAETRSCGISTYQFFDTSWSYFGIGGYQWDFGDGTLSMSKNPTKGYVRDGTYYVQLTVNGISGCIDTLRVPINVSIRKAPVANIGSDTVACTGQTINFAGLIQSQDAVVNIGWLFGNGTAAMGRNVSTVYHVSGTYTVRLITTTLYGCADTAYKTIRVNATPAINAGADVRICRGQSAPLAVYGGDVYRWTPSQNLSCFTCSNPVASPVLSTQYVVVGTTTRGCSSTDTVLIEVVQPFILDVSPNDTICIGETTQLFASGATRYLWNPVTGLSSGTVPNPLASPASTTNYTVIGSDVYNCFTDTRSVRVVVGPYPTVQLNNGGTVIIGSAVALNSVVTNGPIRSYTWTPADDLSCTACPRPVAVINKNITYKLEVENIYGCTASDTVIYKTKCEEATQVYIPNAFSPDGDGLNDVFMIRGKGLSAVKYFRVFNRWGQLIFERNNFAANDPKNGWDGKVNGIAANPDVYVYTAEVTCAAGDTFLRKGNVTLVR